MVTEAFSKRDMVRKRSFSFDEVFLVRYGWSSVVLYSNKREENLGISSI